MNHHKKTPPSRETIIEMVGSLFVLLLRTGDEITEREVSTLFPMLETLFQEDSISWENHLRRLSQKDLDLEEVLGFLNRRLITLDKIRILLSLIVLANSDDSFSAAEVTRILDFSKKLNLETEGFMAIIDAIEYRKSEPVFIRGFRYFSHTNKSIFSDYITLGKNSEASIQFRTSRVADFEVLLLVVDRFVFIGTNVDSAAQINDQTCKPNRLYFLPHEGHLKVGPVTFAHKDLMELYRNRDIHDVIEFQSPHYSFQILNHHNRFSITVFDRTVYLNGRQLALNREAAVYVDDTLQIKGFEPFSLLDVIQRRQEIGVSNLKPDEIYIHYEHDYFTVSQIETTHTVTTIRMSGDGQYRIDPPERGWKLLVNHQPVIEPAALYCDTDIITINDRHFRLTSYFDLIEVPFEIDQVSIQDLKHYYEDGLLGLDSISFEAREGELVAVLGQSGCGKSTLLKCLYGEIIPTYGSILIDGRDYYRNLSTFTGNIGYVPQEDLLYPNLTVYENLWFRGRLQLASLHPRFLHQKINNILSQTNLILKKNTRVGNLEKNYLSGGERKRLNIALELLIEPTLLICDEPTSGLSSTDSEGIIELLKQLTRQGKIVIVTIHQPNPDIFRKFDRVLLMDKGGCQVFFGTCDEAFNYFSDELEELPIRRTEIESKRELRMPDFMFDIIEYPEYDSKGEIKFYRTRDSIAMKRRYPPPYWRDKYKRKTLQTLLQVNDTTDRNPGKTQKQVRKKLSPGAHWVQFRTFVVKNLLSKIRNRSNNIITFGEAPLLAFLLSFILRFAPGEVEYSFQENLNIPVFLFTSVIIFIFLGLSNSVEDILSERKKLLREKMLNIRVSYYLISKLITLSLFSVIQVLLYYAVSAWILELRGMFLPTCLYLFLASMIGFSFGLLISCFIRNSKAVINILPLMLIPQIIFGGAIVQYEKMNRDLFFFKANPVPEVVQIIPARWLFEGMYTAYARCNPFAKEQEKLRKNQLTTRSLLEQDQITLEEYYRRNGEIDRKMETIHQRLPRDRYVNRFIEKSVDFMDVQYASSGANVFLASRKTLFGHQFNTWEFSVYVILLYCLLLNLASYFKMKFYLNE